MFSDPSVIEASRKFVCIRIESYESEENQEIVRSHLRGRFENTAFCVLAPDGEERLTRSGRGPHHVAREFGEIAEIAKRYRPRGKVSESRVPDFNSFKLALNVAAADQRLLVLVAGDEDEIAAAEKRLRPLVWSDELVGRFLYDLETDATEWSSRLARGGSEDGGVYVIQPDTYGLEGKVLARLDLDASNKEIKAALLAANEDFAENTEKKVYSSHVAAGRREGKRIEMPMEFGEDRDGDGVIDHRGGADRRPPPRRPR